MFEKGRRNGQPKHRPDHLLKSQRDAKTVTDRKNPADTEDRHRPQANAEKQSMEFFHRPVPAPLGSVRSDLYLTRDITFA